MFPGRPCEPVPDGGLRDPGFRRRMRPPDPPPVCKKDRQHLSHLRRAKPRSMGRSVDK